MFDHIGMSASNLEASKAFFPGSTRSARRAGA